MKFKHLSLVAVINYPSSETTIPQYGTFSDIRKLTNQNDSEKILREIKSRLEWFITGLAIHPGKIISISHCILEM